MLAGQRVSSLLFSSLLFSSLLFASSSLVAQGTWDGPYTWFAEQGQFEIEHAALIPKGPHQGKVLVWRGFVHSSDPGSQGLWLWDSASPNGVALAIAPGTANSYSNFSCSGTCWDADGDLVIAGGDRNDLPRCGPEALWSHVFNPGSVSLEPSLFQYSNMLIPPVTQQPPEAWGFYYPSTLTLHTGGAS